MSLAYHKLQSMHTMAHTIDTSELESEAADNLAVAIRAVEKALYAQKKFELDKEKACFPVGN